MSATHTIANLPSTRYYSGWRYGCKDPQRQTPKQWWAERAGEKPITGTSETMIKTRIDALYEKRYEQNLLPHARFTIATR